MKQYWSFKEQYPGAILLFRVGDFYETFGEDAVLTSKVLGITLTKRHNGAASEIELAGFPHHALDAYLPKLVRAGHRVAICDQLEDPALAKTIVKRGVTELITPGIVFNDTVLQTQSNNYLAALSWQKEEVGIALLDISTGEFLTTQGPRDTIEKLLQSFAPTEIIAAKSHRPALQQWIGNHWNTYFLEDWFFQYDFGFQQLTQHFRTSNLKGFGIEHLAEGITAAGAILHYLSTAQQQHLSHIGSISRIDESHFVWLDKFTIRNLELLAPQQGQGASLIQVLDKTLTPMGARLLRRWVAFPLKEKNRIEERLQMTEVFLQDSDLLAQVQDHLRTMGDLERLIAKVASRRIMPREMLQLKKGLQQVGKLVVLLMERSEEMLQKLASQLNLCTFLVDKIAKTLREDCKNTLNEGNLIAEGIHEDLDQLRGIVRDSKAYLEQVRQHAIEETGISSLKIDYNKVFGFYLEVTNAHKNKVPKTWIRKQTLTNAERYITEELKVYEDKILNAEEKIVVLEAQLYQQLVMAAVDFIQPVQANARAVAMLDCVSNFAQIAAKNRYTKPIITDDLTIRLQAGRHPVIEQQLPVGEAYIPNDVYLDAEQQQIIIVTGPNMAGKSALLRQVALIVLMAQIGSFVPAETAEIGLVDKVFVRVGASDNISQGESTFMVEMTETASIMNNLSHRSLVLMDEIGRGTSTYDGISIAWSIVEFLHNHPKFRPKTLFATHYHELNELSKEMERIRNFHVTVKEMQGKVIFLRKLAPGGAAHSFGIHVAQMAGMPQPIVLRANEIMQHLEENRRTQTEEERKTLQNLPKAQQYQLSIFEQVPQGLQEVGKMLDELDVNALSPIDALLKLNDLKNKLKK